MSRIARLIAPGYPHHIIQRGNNRKNIFLSDTDRIVYLDLLAEYSKECGCKTKAFCLMDNHTHLLLVPSEQESLSKTMQKVSLTYTQYINRRYKRTGRLWECRFHSSIVDHDTYLMSVCRYIEMNPARAGIINDAQKYKWSSIRINTIGKKEFNFVEPIWKDYISREEYCSFLESYTEQNNVSDDRITKNTCSGLPLGTEKFILDLKTTLKKNIVLSRMCPGDVSRL
jgi:putative transposase